MFDNAVCGQLFKWNDLVVMGGEVFVEYLDLTFCMILVFDFVAPKINKTTTTTTTELPF